MAEWPVEVVSYGALLGRRREPAEATQATRIFDAETGEPIGYVLCCPKCGELGHVDSSAGEDGWRAAEQEGYLSLSPSIRCRCGGHYWLTDGVLKEV